MFGQPMQFLPALGKKLIDQKKRNKAFLGFLSCGLLFYSVLGTDFVLTCFFKTAELLSYCK